MLCIYCDLFHVLLSDADGNRPTDRISVHRYHTGCALHFSGVLIIECEFETCVRIVYSLFHRSSCFDGLEDAEVDQSLCRMMDKNVWSSSLTMFVPSLLVANVNSFELTLSFLYKCSHQVVNHTETIINQSDCSIWRCHPCQKIQPIRLQHLRLSITLKPVKPVQPVQCCQS